MIRDMHGRRLLLRTLTLAFAAIAIGATAAAASETPPRADYALTVWASERGLPPGDVFSLTQDADGYLWLGTPSGLLRFDGVKFVPWSAINEREPLPSGPVHSLLVAHDGSLWAGIGGGGGVVRISGGHVERFTPAVGAPPGATALVEDREGSVWAASRRGLFRYAAGKWTTPRDEPGYPQAEVFSLYEDRAGRLWLGTAVGLFYRSGGRFVAVDDTATGVQGITEDSGGGIWGTDPMHIVARLDDRSAPPPHAPSVRLPASGWRVIADRRGQIWVAAFGGGLLRVVGRPDGSTTLDRFEYEQKLAGSPRSIYEDRDGNIWVGMRGGLLRLSQRAFDSGVPLEGLTHDGVRTTAVGTDGSVWIATGHSINRFLNGRRTTYDVPQPLALHVDRHGTVWATSTQGLLRLSRDRFVAVPGSTGATWTRVMALATDSQDTLWACSSLKGLLAWNGEELRLFDQVAAVADRACVAILADAQDRVWIGFQGGGAALYDKGTFRAFGERDGLTPDIVLGIIQDKTGAIWVSTSGGVSRYQNGRFTPITQRNAPLMDLVPVLVTDDDGYIWAGVNSGLGIIRFHPGEVDKIATNPAHHLEYALYDDTDGLQQAPLTWQSGVGGARGPDGRLWVTSGPGITIIDPHNLPRSRRPPPPYIESVLVNGRRVVPQGDLQLPAGSSALRIEYATVSLSSASKLRYRYRLEGVDEDWVYAGQRREASYASLPSGDYRFRVSATPDGQWTEAGQWQFSVAPPIYLTRWFMALAAIGTLLMIGAAWLLRMRAVNQRYALVFAERARVSREIHDTLLQSVAAMTVELEAIASQLDASQTAARDSLRRLRREARHSLRDARESILELRRDVMRPRDVADGLREIAGRVSPASRAAIDIVVTGRRPATFPADVDLQLLRIGQEAMANAIRHGRAGRIDIEIAYEKGRVVLRVRDNGCGFCPERHDPQSDTGEHLGLVTMRERALRVRGRVNVISSPGAGTTIEAIIPVATE